MGEAAPGPLSDPAVPACRVASDRPARLPPETGPGRLGPFPTRLRSPRPGRPAQRAAGQVCSALRETTAWLALAEPWGRIIGADLSPGLGASAATRRERY